MKILFLVPYPLGEAPSQRFRFEQYFTFLKEVGHDYKVQGFLDQKTWSILYKPGQIFSKAFGIASGFTRRLLILLTAHRYDFIFIHREATPIGPPIIEWLLAKVFKKKIIYDFDDAIWLPNISEENSIAAKLKWHQKVKHIAQWSYKLSCGNEYLANWASQWNDRVFIIPTTIDLVNQHNELHHESSESITIGWTGTHSTAKYLSLIEPALQTLAQKHPTINFSFISNKPIEINLPNLKFIKWNKSSEIEDLNTIDIGIMPLTPDKWSEGKCGFKILQYMALGIPTVASPVGVNKSIIDQGKNGYLAFTPDEWITYLSKLITDKALRNRIGTEGYETVTNRFSTEAIRTRFLDLFSLKSPKSTRKMP